MTRNELREKIRHMASDMIVAEHVEYQLGAYVYLDGAAVNVIAHPDHSSDVAEMLYRAADLYAAHAVNRVPKDQIIKLRD